jgi:hypothetical protein
MDANLVFGETRLSVKLTILHLLSIEKKTGHNDSH